MKRVPRLILLAGLVACVQCSEVNAPARQEEIPPPLIGLIVSGTTVATGLAASGTSDVGVTYVSLPPGTLPLTSSVEIRNRTRNGSPVTIPTVEGGFDPVPIQANADDRLDVTVFGPNGVTAAYSATVPKRKAPTIVRTNPPKGRTDVAFNVRPAIVFSEPIDAGTLNTASVRLLENGVPVPGAVVIGPTNGWTTEFTPGASLKPGTTYQLLVTQDVRDLDGDALDAPAVIEFTTAFFDVTPTGRIAFVTQIDGGGGYVWIANADGSGLKRLPGGPAYFSRPRWSPDGRKILVARFEGDPPASSIYVIDVDGPSSLIRLGAGTDPSWSPDGSKIAFALSIDRRDWPRVAIHVMNADGSGVKRLTDPNDPVQCPDGSTASDWRPDWSPDSRRIVFERQFHTGDGGFDCGLDGWGYAPQLFVMNADGTGLRRLIANGSYVYDAQPAWSPDGKTIAFSISCCVLSLIDADGVGPVEYLYTNADDGGRGRLTPAWSPEGKHLLFLSLNPPTHRLFILELASGKARQLFPAVNGSLLEPSWGRARQ